MNQKRNQIDITDLKTCYLTRLLISRSPVRARQGAQPDGMTGIKWFPFFSLKPPFTPLFIRFTNLISNPFKSITIHQFTNQKGTTKMKKSKIRELKRVGRVDKSHIKEFLRVHKFDLHNNWVSYLFKEADMTFPDSQSTIQPGFTIHYSV
jgi:hypothetical protein